MPPGRHWTPVLHDCRYAVAAFVRHDGQEYTNGPQIRAAPGGVFFWLHTFKLGVYPGAVLPFMIGYLADAAVAVGDLTATEEASFLETHGVHHEQRVQGCLLADGELGPAWQGRMSGVLQAAF